ncbi:hypothetical protein [Wenzhouxiangella sp. XN24]|uniref:hypothetical protein n=1 Tax=Wenzhouxiangella sp. XN24 TaxID=2713569 RepID=UPI0013EB89BF|nr:hypothetical protein [Wenzhouxiangella sp. XN24]NGX15692.1 hypothetical protein [Wenzhouxiangella sp. XN24]
MWRLVAPALALLLLGASFFRAGNDIMVGVVAGLLVLLAVPQPWAARVVQGALALGALRWLWLAWAMASVRMAADVPYLRMVLILGAVAVLTLLAMAVFRSRRLRRYYRLDTGPAP